ncbi:MAG TPA: Gfo/Idh/MocA family oxidoreductase [Lacipirellula sp.]
MLNIPRRTFLAGAAAGAALTTVSRSRAADANSTVVLALMGANNRGSQLAKLFVEQPNARIAYVCDPDERAIAKGIAAATSKGGPAPKGIRDFREALDDPAVDGLICAAPNHWHAAATLLACDAGKHVYVEKPASQTAEEGELMTAVARSKSRVVQVGMQRRSGPLYKNAVEKIQSGAIGKPLLAKSWYFTPRPSIGHGKKAPPPAWLDYDLWQGPALATPYRDNILHYNWHFFWRWGNGEIGNNGVHTIDICRWALGVDYPTRVTFAGARLRYDDDQQTPDTATATFECGDKLITWEGVSWLRHHQSKSTVGIEVRGTDGTMVLDDDGFTIYDPERKVVATHKDSRGDAEHVQDFLTAVGDGHRTNADIEEGHKSALFCHLGNMAYRTDGPVNVDPATGRIRDNDAAAALWSEERRPGWLPSVS